MRTAFAPGRVNLIGEHTDYAGGLSLPFAIDRGVEVRAWPHDHRTVEVEALDQADTDRFELGSSETAEGWRAYVRGTAAELDRAVKLPNGARLEIAGDLPTGAGLGSSAALCLAVWLALAAASGRPSRAEAWEVADRLSRVEREWAGAETGTLDQLASLLGRPHRAVLLDFGRQTAEHVPLELGEWTLAIVFSGAERSHSSSQYNRRRAEWEAAREGLERSELDQLEEPLRRRARHVTSENARVREASGALHRGDVAALGPLLDASHASLRDDLEVSVPAVELAVQRAKAAGAAGARIHGGGFGGGVLALFPPEAEVPAGALEVSPSRGAGVLR